MACEGTQYLFAPKRRTFIAMSTNRTPANNDSSNDINVVALVKGEERYVYVYTDKNKEAILRVLGEHAKNPDLSFTWHDALILSLRIRGAAT